ncbi:MAG: hypothetical protein H7Z42_07035 [Roseiflexaceae bacterium]|nr:hypothetical protein [Roseiflexaceae bacterium]
MQQPSVTHLAAALRRRRLDGAARLALEVIVPIAFIACQAALFARPLTPPGRWRDYVDLMTTEANWNALRCSIDQQEC